MEGHLLTEPLLTPQIRTRLPMAVQGMVRLTRRLVHPTAVLPAIVVRHMAARLLTVGAPTHIHKGPPDAVSEKLISQQVFLNHSLPRIPPVKTIERHLFSSAGAAVSDLAVAQVYHRG